MNVRLTQVSYCAICCIVATLKSGMVIGAPLVIHTGDAVEMAGGTYQFDSLTIEPSGQINFTGSTTLNILGDVTVGHDTVITMHEDPDTHQIITQTEDRFGQLTVGLALTGLPLSQAQGTPGTPGADGTNGSGGTLFPLASTPGGPGGNGGAGASLVYSIVGNGNLGLNINSGGTVTINGIIHQEIFLLSNNFPAASGGGGGVGGHGGNGDFSDPNVRGDGGAAGSGGHGGSGGSGASTKPFHIAINAAADVSVGPTGQLSNVNDFGGGANGGRGGDGGQGGSGTFATFQIPDGGVRGDGGHGGDGGQGGAGAATGDIFIQARTIAFAGSVYQPGGSGGGGGHGGNGGAVGVTGGTIGRTGDGGAGGSGGPGGDGGNLIFRAGTVDFTSAPDALYQPGGGRRPR